jgi:hypothetical protein
MVKNKSRLATKLFIIVWIILAINIALKITFNYWQPYVISSDRLQNISDFIDSNRWIRTISDAITYTFNGLIMILASLQIWWFKNKKQSIIVISLIILGFIYSLIFNDSTLNTIFITIVLPIIIDRKRWLSTIITFALNNIFVLLSLWLSEFANCDDMNYFIQLLFFFDYYIMLILNYFVFNLIRKKE